MREIEFIAIDQPKKFSEMNNQEKLNAICILHKTLRDKDDFYYASNMKDTLDLAFGIDQKKEKNNKE